MSQTLKKYIAGFVFNKEGRVRPFVGPPDAMDIYRQWKNGDKSIRALAPTFSEFQASKALQGEQIIILVFKRKKQS